MNRTPGDFRAWNENYWEGTYRELNPFMPLIRCPNCGEKPTRERTWYPERYCDAVSITEFCCGNGHTWERKRTHD